MSKQPKLWDLTPGQRIRHLRRRAVLVFAVQLLIVAVAIGVAVGAVLAVAR